MLYFLSGFVFGFAFVFFNSCHSVPPGNFHFAVCSLLLVEDALEQ